MQVGSLSQARFISCFHGDKWESQCLLCIGRFLGNFNSELSICHWGTCWAACPRGPCLIHLCRAPLLLRWSTRVVVKWMGKETCAVGLLLREACPSELWDRIHSQTQKASWSLYLQMGDVTGLEVWPPGEQTPHPKHSHPFWFETLGLPMSS